MLCSEVMQGARCQQRDSLEVGNKPRKAPEAPQRAAMPPKTSHMDSSSTAGGVGVPVAAMGGFNIGNSC
jgi:hypothetical protein